MWRDEQTDRWNFFENVYPLHFYPIVVPYCKTNPQKESSSRSLDN